MMTETRFRQLMVDLEHAALILNALVRPTLAWGFGAATIVLTFIGYLPPEGFLALAGMMFGFFFQAREAQQQFERLQAQQDQLVAMARELPPTQEPPP